MLNYQQEKIAKEAVDWFYHSSEQVFEFAGGAGTGKTYLISEILRRLNLNVNQYYPMAYTGQASIVMRTRGFQTARSIHSTLYEVVEVYSNSEISKTFGIPNKRYEFRLKQMLDPNICLFFIDEGYMVPRHMVQDILSFGIKVIVCGDTNQLPPVGDDPGFLISNKVRYLTEKMRQAETDPIVYLADRAIKGLPIHGGYYGNVLVIDDTDFLPEYTNYAQTIICGTNKTREVFNNYVRQIRGYTTSTPNFGERVICRNNNWNVVVDGISLCNGLTGTVISQLEPGNFDSGHTFIMNFKPDLIDNAFYGLPVNYDYFIANYTEKQAIKEKMKWVTGELFEFAYAKTCWLEQGSEYDHGIYIEEFMRPQIQNQLNYTGITRFKKSMIYVRKTNKYFNLGGIH